MIHIGCTDLKFTIARLILPVWSGERVKQRAKKIMPMPKCQTPRSAANMLVLLDSFVCVYQEQKTQTNPAFADVDDDESGSPQNLHHYASLASRT